MYRQLHRFFFVAAIVFLSSAAAPAAEPTPIGGKGPELVFTDRWFLTRSVNELKYRAVVLVVMDSTCPLVKRLVPLLNTLQESLWKDGRNVLVLGVFPDPRETPHTIQRYAQRFGVAFPVVKLVPRPGGKSVSETLAALGLSTLSASLLLGESKEILYRGRFSDKARLTGFVENGRDHLKEALGSYLAGRPLETAEVPSEGCLIEKEPAEEAPLPVTWKEVAPILSRHCVACHRPGGAGPFALNTFEAAARKARTVARAVTNEQMPPWYASPHTVSPFLNESRLDAREKRTLVDWARTGAPGPGGAPLESTAHPFPAPDVVYESREITVPASGKIPYVNIPLLRSLANQDRWIAAIRIVPTNPRVVHHANLAYVRPVDLLTGVTYKNFVTGYVPGASPMILEPGIGLKQPKQSFLGLQVHVVTVGSEQKTTIRVEVKFTDRVTRRLRFHHFDKTDLSIPPGDPHHEVRQEWTTPDDIEIVGAFAHMHYRGKDFELKAQAGNETRTLLEIPNYIYDWQMGYQWPTGKVFASRGTRFTTVAHFDNSRFNVFNPNPATQVTYGEQSDDEMMLGFLFYLLKVEDLSKED